MVVKWQGNLPYKLRMLRFPSEWVLQSIPVFRNPSLVRNVSRCQAWIVELAFTFAGMKNTFLRSWWIPKDQQTSWVHLERWHQDVKSGSRKLWLPIVTMSFKPPFNMDLNFSFHLFLARWGVPPLFLLLFASDGRVKFVDYPSEGVDVISRCWSLEEGRWKISALDISDWWNIHNIFNILDGLRITFWRDLYIFNT